MGKDGKVKKEKKSESAEDNYESRLSALNEISKPLASKKLNKKLLKNVRKGILIKIDYFKFQIMIYNNRFIVINIHNSKYI